MYEQPSMYLELAKQRQSMFVDEAERARLAATAPRRRPQILSILTEVVENVRGILSHRHEPVPRTIVHGTA